MEWALDSSKVKGKSQHLSPKKNIFTEYMSACWLAAFLRNRGGRGFCLRQTVTLDHLRLFGA